MRNYFRGVINDSVNNGDFVFAPHAQAVGGPDIPQVEANAPGGINFRRATTRRSSELTSTTVTMTTAQQNVEVTVEGSGYIYGIVLEVTCTTAANAAVVAYNEDAPFNALASVILSDTNGQSHNVSGFNLWLAGIYGGFNPHATLEMTSADTRLFSQVAGAVATGGSFKFLLPVPVALNRRNLLGLLANQDRAQKYQLRSDVAASTDVYSTSPTTLGSVAIRRWYDNYSVPAAQNANGQVQQIVPDKWGAIHYITQTVSESAPAASSTVNFFLRRIGQNVIRVLILVFRSGTGGASRAAAEVIMPTRISFKLGDTVVHTVNTSYQRHVMFNEYGFDAPDGVIVFGNITDLFNAAGSEMGDDWAFTAGLVNASMDIDFPAGWAAGSTLTIVTDDISFPPNVNPYA